MTAAGEGLINTNKANEPWGAWYPSRERLETPVAYFEKDDESNDAPQEAVAALELHMTTEADGRQRMVDMKETPFMRRGPGDEIITGGLGEVWKGLPDHRLRLHYSQPDPKTGETTHYIFRKLGDDYAEWRWSDDGSPGGTGTSKKISVIDEAEATRRIQSLKSTSRYPEPEPQQRPPAWRVPESRAQTEQRQPSAEPKVLQQAAAETTPPSQSWGRKFIERVIRRPLGGTALQANATTASATHGPAKSPATGHGRHARPKTEKGPEPQPGRRARYVGAFAMMGLGVVGLGVAGTLYASSAAPANPGVAAVAANGSHAESVSATPAAAPKPRITIIAGAAIPADSQRSPDNSAAPAPTKAKPATPTDVAMWDAAKYMVGTDDAENMVEHTVIPEWNATHPGNPLHLVPTSDGKFKEPYTNEGPIDKGTLAAVDQMTYGMGNMAA